MEATKDWLQIITGLITVAGIVFIIYKFFRDPDIKNGEEISLIKQSCELRHKSIDENILGIKENHLRHLESDMSAVKLDIAKILVILEERYKKGG